MTSTATGVDPNTTLTDAKTWLRNKVDDGAHCPCCGQFAKVYKRQINGHMAHALILMYRAGAGWHHLPTIYPARGDTAKLSYWGLLEEETTARPDGGRSGWWQVTERGRQFVTLNLCVPKYALVYDGRLLGFDGELRDIRASLGKHFDYKELMDA